MLQFGRKQYTVAHSRVPNLSLIGGRGVCTGTPKFPLSVRFGVIQC